MCLLRNPHEEEGGLHEEQTRRDTVSIVNMAVGKW